jgi:predicted ABC-type ATPase
LAFAGVDLHFLWVPSVELAVQRVATRVKSGGHDIPERTIRRRYERGLTNFRDLYQNAVDRWFVYDASLEFGPIRIALADKSGLHVEDRPGWDLFSDCLR